MVQQGSESTENLLAQLKKENCVLREQIEKQKLLLLDASYGYNSALIMFDDAKRQVSQDISLVNNYSAYQLAYILSRFRNQFLKGNLKEKKNFLQWIIYRRYDEAGDHQYNPLVAICNNFHLLSQDKISALSQDLEMLWREMIMTKRRFGIIATKHVGYVAEILKDALEDYGFSADIQYYDYNTPYLDFDTIPYIIISPQWLRTFPCLYITYQMEQYLADRWFTKNYYDVLEKSWAILDYSKENIAHYSLERSLTNKTYYCPVTVNRKLLKKTLYSRPVYDVLFYGSVGSKRRMDIIEELGKQFRIKILHNVFGKDLYDELRKAKIVLNVHFYDEALLETTRLSEILSLGSSIIVSENSSSPDMDNEFKPYVDFVPAGDSRQLSERISFWLSHEEERKKKINENTLKLRATTFDTSYYLGQFLLASNFISQDEFSSVNGKGK